MRKAMPTSPLLTSPRHAPKTNGAAAPAEWIPLDAWVGFIESRKKKPTPRAVSLIVKKLERLKAEGDDVGEVLDQSTLSGWPGVYPLKERHKHNGNSTVGSRRTANNRANLETFKQRDAKKVAAGQGADS